MNRVVVRVLCLVKTSTLFSAFALALLFVLISIRGVDNVASDLENHSLMRKYWRDVVAVAVKTCQFSNLFTDVVDQAQPLPEGWRSDMSGKHPLVQVWVDPRYEEPEDGAWERPLSVDKVADPLGLFSTAQSNASQSMNSTVLVNRLKEVMLPPSTAKTRDGRHAYNLTHADVEDPSDQQITKRKILKLLLHLGLVNRTGGYGVFVEAGALDGETTSKTLFLERFYGWTGLLVEMTAPNLRLLIRKRRRAWVAPVCISPEPRPLLKRMKYVYDPENPHEERTGTISRLKWQRKNEHPPNYQRPVHYVYTVVECYPLYSLLLASGVLQRASADSNTGEGAPASDDPDRTSNAVNEVKTSRGRIDLMSLDLEGVELQVLKTIPWDRVDISVLVVDVYHVEEGSAALRQYLHELKYELWAKFGGEWIFFKNASTNFH